MRKTIDKTCPYITNERRRTLHSIEVDGYVSSFDRSFRSAQVERWAKHLCCSITSASIRSTEWTFRGLLRWASVKKTEMSTDVSEDMTFSLRNTKCHTTTENKQSFLTLEKKSIIFQQCSYPLNVAVWFQSFNSSRTIECWDSLRLWLLRRGVSQSNCSSN